MRSARNSAVQATTSVKVLSATSNDVVDRDESRKLVVICVTGDLIWKHRVPPTAIALSAAYTVTRQMLPPL